MKQVLKIELRKAICNKYFFFTLLVGILITLFSAGVQVETYQSYRELIDTKTVNAEGEYRKDPAIPGYSLYNNWVGGEASSVGHAAFYMLLPLLVLLYGAEDGVRRADNAAVRKEKISFFQVRRRFFVRIFRDTPADACEFFNGSPVHSGSDAGPLL